MILSVECVLLSGAELDDASPFLPPDSGKPAPPSVPAPTLANLQFASVLSFGREVLVSVFDVRTSEGVWIPVGGEAEGIRVITYDPENEEVTILSAGVTARLKLREAQFTAGGLIRPLPTLEQEYGRPLTVEEQETEARMLVSDLLEIGMKERARQRELRREEIKRLRTKTDPSGRPDAFRLPSGYGYPGTAPAMDRHVCESGPSAIGLQFVAA